jgi:flagellar basal body-associated protein FliL
MTDQEKKPNHKKAYLIIFLAAFLMSSGVAGSFYLTIKKSRDLNQNKAIEAQKNQEKEQLSEIEETSTIIEIELDNLEKELKDINQDESYLDDSPVL